MKIDLITLSALTSSDGSIVASGATVKFQTLFELGTTNFRIYPKIYRSIELFELGYLPVVFDEQDFPNEIYFNTLTENEFYNITPEKLFTIVKNKLNEYYGAAIFEVKIIKIN